LDAEDILFSLIDVSFVFINLEDLGRRELAISTRTPPYVKEIAMATLDTRGILRSSTHEPRFEQLIKTRQFPTSNASKEFEHCDVTDFRECIFAETFLLS
jgi:hypothetical protein